MTSNKTLFAFDIATLSASIPALSGSGVLFVEGSTNETRALVKARILADPNITTYSQLSNIQITDTTGGGTSQGTSIDDFAGTAMVYGTWRLRNVNDTSFFNPRVIINSDGSYSLADDATYTPPSGKAICYQFDYNIAGYGITSLSGRIFWRPLFIQKFEYEVARPDYERLQVARVEHNTIIH